jgi:hypothetical protein
MRKLNYWLLFAATQLCGTVIPYFGNVHMNIVPIMLGAALLFPGIMAENISAIDHLPTAMLFAVVILLNAAVWYLIRKILLLDAPGSPPPSDDAPTSSSRIRP